MDNSASRRGPGAERARIAPPPLVLLAGSDARPTRLTDAGRGYRALTGYKSALLRVDGRPLVRCIIDRLAESGRFSDLYVAGPARVYAELVDGARLVDCDDRLEGNLRTSFEAVREDHPHGPIAFLASDVLPDVKTIRGVMDRYADEAPCDVFFPLVEVPADASALGPSEWKPRYMIRPDAISSPRSILPGHLVIVDPDALRIGLLYRLLALSYRTRNRPIGGRGLAMLRGVLMHALREDLRQLITLGLPDLTAALIADWGDGDDGAQVRKHDPGTPRASGPPGGGELRASAALPAAPASPAVLRGRPLPRPRHRHRGGGARDRGRVAPAPSPRPGRQGEPAQARQGGSPLRAGSVGGTVRGTMMADRFFVPFEGARRPQ